MDGGYSLNSSLFSRGSTTTVSVSTRKLDTNSSICSSSPKIWPTSPPRSPRFYNNDQPTLAAVMPLSRAWVVCGCHLLSTLFTPRMFGGPFPSSVQHALVSTDNPSSSITNSDLELAGTIAHEATLATVHDLRHSTIATFSDNTPAVAWGNKASTTTASPVSYLLRSSSLLLHQHRYLSQQFYIPGPANCLANVASRSFDLSYDALLVFLDSVASQTQSWQMLHLPSIWLSWLTTDMQ